MDNDRDTYQGVEKMTFFKRKKEDRGEGDLALGKSLMKSNVNAAVEALYRSANKENVEAQYLLGSYYESKNSDLAAGYYERCYRNGCAKAGFRLAKINLMSPDGDRELVTSVIADAFKKRDDSVFDGSLDVLYDIGITLYDGTGFFTDADMSKIILQKCADLDHSPSAEFLKKNDLV